jgi:hypothetical protein
MNANSEGNSYGYRSERQNREVLSQRRGALGSSDASGRSAADAFFYSVKDSRRGATTFLPQLVAPVLLTAAPCVFMARIRNIRHVVARLWVSPVGREVVRGCGCNPKVEAEPHVLTCEFSGFSG